MEKRKQIYEKPQVEFFNLSFSGSILQDSSPITDTPPEEQI